MNDTGWIEMVLAIAGGLILILLGIIGWWIQKWIRSTDKLTTAIGELRIDLATSRNDLANIQSRFLARENLVDERLNKHSVMIHQHETEIAILKNRKHETQ